MKISMIKKLTFNWTWMLVNRNFLCISIYMYFERKCASLNLQRPLRFVTQITYMQEIDIISSENVYQAFHRYVMLLSPCNLQMYE